MRKALLVIAVILSSSCAGLLKLNPLPSDAAEIRQTAARIADGVLVAEVALDQAGAVVDALPISTGQKDALDCGILKVNGHDAPSPTVLKVCGPVPPFKEAPIGKALQALRGVTSRPGLCGTVAELLTLLQPLIASLKASGVPIQTVTVALGFTLRFAGGCV